MRLAFVSCLVLCSIVPSLIGCNRSYQKRAKQERKSAGSAINSETQAFDHSDSSNDDASIDGIAELSSVALRAQQSILAEEIKLGDQIGSWKTEAFHESIKQHLKTLAKKIETRDWHELRSLAISDRFTCSDLRPQENQLDEVFADENLAVYRPSATFQTEATHSYLVGLENALRRLTSPFDANSAFTINFKAYKVKLLADHAESEMYVDTDGVGQTGGVQQNMTWICKWQRVQNDWALSSMKLERFEEIHFRHSTSGKLFADCTASVLSANDCFKTHLQHGIDHWRLRFEERFGIDSISLTGLAIGDVNGDGLDDVYFCDVGGLPNRLFVQRPDGTAVDVSADAGVDWLDRSYGALFVDLDNDGDQDLIVTASTSVILMENDGSGKFAMRGRIQPHPTAQSLTAVDYDNDGRLDIYVCSYGNSFETFADSKTPLPWHDANNGAPNTMFRNLGDWNFKNVTLDIGLDENNRRFSYAASWDDFDNDGDQDLYVANDFGRNNLFINEINRLGRFRDVAKEYGVEDISPSMSVDWGDYNNDGQMDLYVSNMFSSAGNRVTFQNEFMSGSPEELIENYRRFARGNTLFRSGEGSPNRETVEGQFTDRAFDDVSVAAGVTMGRWAWSSLFVDINNDGWQDLLVANGHVSGVESDDL